jgi:multiple sugar transport system substrate-binding protein
MAATSSGQGPDVLNIGNTWSASLQATGALLPWDDANMKKIGGASKFNASALASTGVAGKAPAAVPLYALSYALYWNKAEFAKAGISGPPKTWSELVADGKKLTGNGKWGIALECGQYQENAHHAFAFGQQLGANFFTKDGKPDFDSPQAVQAVKQYVDLMATDKIASPSDAEYANNQSVTDFANGKAAMLLWQAAGTSLKAQGMKSDAYGVAQVPFQTSDTTGKVDTMAAGINMAVFKDSKNLTGAEKFVNFMTSTTEQRIINGKYGSISPVTAAAADPIGATPELATLKQALANNSAPLPQVADESQFETLVGTAMKNLFADAAGGKTVDDATIKSELTKAQQQMPAS